jgi:hypothetical protein
MEICEAICLFRTICKKYPDPKIRWNLKPFPLVSSCSRIPNWVWNAGVTGSLAPNLQALPLMMAAICFGWLFP